MTHQSLQNTEEDPIAPGTTPAAPVAHPRYLLSPAGATLPQKPQGFVPKLSPKTKPMQQPCSHYNAFENLTSQTRISLRTWQHNMATFMLPFHYNLQPMIPNHPTTAHTQAHPQQLEATVRLRQKKTSKRSYPRSTHPRYLSSPAGATLPGKTQGFVPKLSPKTKPRQHPCSH